MTRGTRGLGGRWPAVLGGAAGVFLLLLPLPFPPPDRIGSAISDSMHVALFAALAWLWGRRTSARWRGWRLWVLLVLFAAGMEWLQSFTGRSPEWMDGLYGAGGAAILCGSWQWRWLRPLRWGALIALCLFPFFREWTRLHLEVRAFPALVDPDAGWASKGWVPSGVWLAGAQAGGLRVEAVPGDGKTGGRTYPGLFRTAAHADWSGARALQAALFWPAPEPVVMAIRVDDRSGNPPYAERFQKEFTVTQGWNSMQIPLEELQWTAGGRALDLARIRQWGVFLVSGAPLDYFLLGSVRLELKEEQP